MRLENRANTLALLSLLLLVGIVVGVWYLADHLGGEGSPDGATSSGERAILEAFDSRSSGLVVESGGVVDRILDDDLDGDRHQRFVVRLASGHTVLISHNIDLAPRAPVGRGDVVEFRGQYEWNERGGVIHWTHHDPRGQRPGGWLRHDGRLYR
jgi:hypothetical protein